MQNLALLWAKPVPSLDNDATQIPQQHPSSWASASRHPGSVPQASRVHPRPTSAPSRAQAASAWQFSLAQLRSQKRARANSAIQAATSVRAGTRQPLRRTSALCLQFPSLKALTVVRKRITAAPSARPGHAPCFWNGSILECSRGKGKRGGAALH